MQQRRPLGKHPLGPAIKKSAPQVLLSLSINCRLAPASGRRLAAILSGAAAGSRAHGSGQRGRTLVSRSKCLPPSSESPKRELPLPASRQDLLDRIASLGIEVKTVDHEAVFTVAQSSQLHRDISGGHSKNLFLQDKKGRLFLIVALADTRVDLKSLQKQLKADRWSFGKPDLLFEVLGVTPGSVTPFALINDKDRRVTVILDADMMAHERLNFHPLENTATTNIAREDLLRFIRACGHEPQVMKLASEAAGA